MYAPDSGILVLCHAPFMGTHAQWILIVSNIFLGVTATLSNACILAALHRELSLHPTSKILLRSLALTDLCVGIVLEPQLVVYLLAIEYERRELCSRIVNVMVFSNLCFCVLSLFVLTAISVDRLLALLLGMRYRQVVTSQRVTVIVTLLWILSIGFALSSFWDFKFVSYYSTIANLLCVIISTCCYTMIYQKLLHHHAQIHGNLHQGQPNGHEPLNIARYRKTVSSALWIQLTLVTCYLPVSIVTGIATVDELTDAVRAAWTFSITLAFFNSTLNPILYCWKIREVRRAVVETVRKICCCLSF